MTVELEKLVSEAGEAVAQEVTLPEPPSAATVPAPEQEIADPLASLDEEKILSHPRIGDLIRRTAQSAKDREIRAAEIAAERRARERFNAEAREQAERTKYEGLDDLEKLQYHEARQSEQSDLQRAQQIYEMARMDNKVRSEAAAANEAVQFAKQQGVTEDIIADLMPKVEDGRPDPRYPSYGAFLNAVVDKVVEAKLPKAAEKMAVVKAEAQVKQRLVEAHAQEPNPDTGTGTTPSDADSLVHLYAEGDIGAKAYMQGMRSLGLDPVTHQPK